MNFDIRLSVSKLKGSCPSLSKRVSDSIMIKLIYNFCESLREEYISLVMRKINSSRYDGQWEPVEDERYIDYLGVTPRVDIVRLLREALEVKKLGYDIYLRVNPKMKYPGSDLTVLKVLRALENGTSEFSARPILRSVSKEINSNLTDLWLDWLGNKNLI